VSEEAATASAVKSATPRTAGIRANRLLGLGLLGLENPVISAWIRAIIRRNLVVPPDRVNAPSITSACERPRPKIAAE
jgi:hypothetical protein